MSISVRESQEKRVGSLFLAEESVRLKLSVFLGVVVASWGQTVMEGNISRSFPGSFLMMVVTSLAR